MKEKEARAKFRQVSGLYTCTVNLSQLIHQFSIELSEKINSVEVPDNVK